MKITGVETYLLDIPLRQRPITDSQSRVESVEFIVVRVATDEGLEGWGFNWNYSKGTRAVKVMIDDVYAPYLINKNPMDRRSLCKELMYTTHFIGRVGVALVGICAIEIALWDLHCKRLGLPLWRVLGPVRDRVKAYNTDGGWLSWTVGELIEDMQKLVARGFDTVKMKIGRPSPREDYERVKAVRNALGSEVNLLVDVNTQWDLNTAMVWGRRLEELHIGWLEEPLHPFDVKGHAELAAALDVPIAVGETIYSKYAFRDYIERGAVDILQADVTKLSGIDEWLEVAGLASAHNIPLVPHTNVQQKIHVQLAAATPQALMVEYCYESLSDIWKEPLTVQNGFYSLPQEAGVGCELTPEVLTKYRVA
jgi:L-alanine-DL-glutamate epimerase-like enolase superfamily enzyme